MRSVAPPPLPPFGPSIRTPVPEGKSGSSSAFGKYAPRSGRVSSSSAGTSYVYAATARVPGPSASQSPGCSHGRATGSHAIGTPRAPAAINSSATPSRRLKTVSFSAAGATS